jgi:hypothetical protein
MLEPGVNHLTKRRDISLPILYGLKCNHPDKTELSEIIQRSQLALHERRVMEILEAIDAKGYLLWAALQERKRALAAIQRCPDEAGKRLLEVLLMGWFEQIPAFAQGGEVNLNLADEKKVEIPPQEFDPQELSSGLSSLSYRSVGLGLRQQIRQTPISLISDIKP